MAGIELIAAERQRQVEVEGYTSEHDDAHEHDELALAAATYALPPRFRLGILPKLRQLPDWFRFTPEDRVREMIKVGAFAAAEIDRLQRLK